MSPQSAHALLLAIGLFMCLFALGSQEWSAELRAGLFVLGALIVGLVNQSSPHKHSWQEERIPGLPQGCRTCSSTRKWPDDVSPATASKPKASQPGPERAPQERVGRSDGADLGREIRDILTRPLSPEDIRLAEEELRTRPFKAKMQPGTSRIEVRRPVESDAGDKSAWNLYFTEGSGPIRVEADERADTDAEYVFVSRNAVGGVFTLTYQKESVARLEPTT